MTSNGPAPAAVHLVPHTHWDREWYEPFQRFRLRLVDLVDAVIDRAEADRRFCFTFDGQTAMLDDYLEIRPDAEPRLAALVAAGQLAVGPWRILSDEFLVAGETLARNLEAGMARAAALGGAMAVGYLPDQFGHAAQIPQLLARAGIGHAVLWRGVPAAVDRHAFRWVAPDGSAVRAEYLVGGYGNAAGLFAGPGDPAGAVGRLRERMAPWFGDDPVLAMYGTDHSAPAADLLRMVEAANRVGDGPRLVVGTLAGYLDAVAAGGDGLPVWSGELRSGARANLLMGVVSARVDLKAAFSRAERLLARYAEPFQALHGAAWPAPFLALAWRRLVESSGHDSITGCGADEVAAEVAVRIADAAQLGAALAGRAAARVTAAVGRGAVAVLNPTPARRSGQVELDVAVPEAWPEVAVELPDGRRLATQERGRGGGLVHREELAGSRLADLPRRVHDRELFGRVLNGFRVEAAPGAHRVTIEVGDHADPPELDAGRLRAELEAAAAAAPTATFELLIVEPPRRRLLADVPVPALGWTTLAPREGRGAGPAVPATASGGRLDNGLLAVEIAADGTLRVRGPVDLDGVGGLVDGGDAGDLYNHAPPPTDRLVDRPERVRVATVAAGPLRAELAVERVYRWPVGLDAAGTARSAALAEVTAVTRVELRAGEPFVRLRVDLDNPCRDHRVRLWVPLARRADRSAAEGQFAVVERGRAAEGGHGELPLATFPAAGFVDAGGVAVLLDHVTEYELAGDPPALALTVLRAVGRISRNAHRYREEPAGPELATPAAQCLGPRTVRLAVLPHAGSWHEDGVLDQMERFRHDLLVAPGAAAPGATGPAEADGLAVGGDGVVLSALRRRGDWLELRLVCERPSPAVATVSGRVAAARDADLLGRPGADLPVAGGALRLDLAAWEVRTVQLRRAPADA